MGAKALRNYTTEELKAELRRRYDEERAKRELVPRCRRCIHWGTVDQYGRPAKQPARVPSTAACPLMRWGKKNHPRFMAASHPGCEHYEYRGSGVNDITK